MVEKQTRSPPPKEGFSILDLLLHSRTAATMSTTFSLPKSKIAAVSTSTVYPTRHISKFSSHPLLKQQRPDDTPPSLPMINARTFTRYLRLVLPSSYCSPRSSGIRLLSEKRPTPASPEGFMCSAAAIPRAKAEEVSTRKQKPVLLIDLGNVPPAECSSPGASPQAKAAKVPTENPRRVGIQAETSCGRYVEIRDRKRREEKKSRNLHVRSINPLVVPLNRADAEKISIFEYMKKFKSTIPDRRFHV